MAEEPSGPAGGGPGTYAGGREVSGEGREVRRRGITGDKKKLE